jgi:DUF971 family protein
MIGGGDELARFEVREDGALLLEWQDGHQSVLSPETLRAACPCAACAEERSAGLAATSAAAAGSFIRGIARVGRYALGILWSDGHRTGIYSWPLLRELCDCVLCRMQKGML